MACPFIHLDLSPISPNGRYVCVTEQTGHGFYLPCVAELRESCLTTACGNPACPHRPGGAEREKRVAS